MADSRTRSLTKLRLPRRSSKHPGDPSDRSHNPTLTTVVLSKSGNGSVLFFVWQQQREDFLPFEGDFRTSRETRGIFGRPSNVFLVKATYWFAR